MVGPERIGALVGPLVAVWQERPHASPGADEALALGLWWGVVEPCDPDLRAGCLTAAHELFAAAGVGRTPADRWSAVDPEARAAGYHRGAALLGRTAQGNGPADLPGWAVG